MHQVSKTLYIPLYGKAYVSRKGIILSDKKAEEIWEKEGFPLKGKAKSKWLAYYMGMRAAVFDDWAKARLSCQSDAVVLHLGCGMDSRILRSGDQTHPWYDVDFPAVLEERMRYYQPSALYQMIPGDLRSGDFLSAIPGGAHAIILMEGVSMYLTQEELKRLLAALNAHFTSFSLLMDVYTPLAARLSRYRNPIRSVGVSSVYGVDAPETLLQNDIAFVKAHEITPQRYINALSGMEKRLFCKLYAGKFSQKLYQLWEFQGK